MSDGHALYYGPDLRHAEKIKERERIRFCPRLNQAMYGKRYVLPNYRQPDYYPQTVTDKMFASALWTPCQIPSIDDVMNAGLINAIQALKFGRPQLWLERELGEAFMRTNLPEDMVSDDVYWRWGGFRVHLPKKLLHLADRKEGGHDLMFMDISLVPDGKRLRIPAPYAEETEALGREYNWDDPSLVRRLETLAYDQTALVVSGNLDGEGEGAASFSRDIALGDFMVYAVVKPFAEAVRFGQISRVSHDTLLSPYESTHDDRRFYERMLHLALNILLYLGSVPLEYAVKERIMRKPKMEGKHPVPGLYAARFVGASQLKPETRPHHLADPSLPGRTVAAHCRAGHWTRQVYGPKRGLRKLIWIQPMWIHGEALLEEEQLKKEKEKT
jgi:hypothetical protein